MITRLTAIVATGLILGLSACSDSEDAAAPDSAAASAQDATQTSGLAIETAQAQLAEGVPLGTVPGRVTLAPQARVAVTPPFAGAAIRVYVTEGQAVSRGAPLALVRAAEPVSISADLSRARSQLQLAEAQASRMGQLLEEGIVAQARMDQAQAELQQARATLAEAQRMAAISGTGPDGTMTLRAPISGRVAHVGVETGGPVDGMEAPFVVEANGPYRLELQLPERLARQARPGMAVEVSVTTGIDGQEMPIGGQVLAVAPSIDPQTRAVPATASVSAAPGIVSGQNVMVTITGTSTTSGVSVPSAAVTRIGGEDHVFIKEGDGFSPRAVTVVANAGGTAVISEGLDPGETVATSSLTELKAAAAE